MTKLHFLSVLILVGNFSIIKVKSEEDSLDTAQSPSEPLVEKVCPEGRFSFSDKDVCDGFVCIPCDEASFKPYAGNYGCTSCPEGSRTNKYGALELSDCLCSPGLYQQEVSTLDGLQEKACVKCPSGGICDGFRDEITPRPGYWLDKVPVGNYTTRFDILSCFGYQNCLGSNNNTCAEGWGGNLCSLCAYDNGNKDGGKYFSFFGSCKRCYSTAVNVLLHIAVYLSWILLNVFVAEQYTVIALAIDWMQLMSIIGYVNTGWPQSVAWVLNIARFFSFDLDVVSWQCISNWNFFWETLLQFFLPFALSLFWVILLAPVILYRDRGGRKNMLRKMAKDKSVKASDRLIKKIWKWCKALFASFGFLDYFYEDINWNFLKAKILVSFESTYVISTYYALASLSHREIGGKTVVSAAPYYEVSTQSLILGITGLIVLSIGFPLLLFFKLLSFGPKHDNDPGKFVDPSVEQTYEWLYSRFRIGKWKLAFCGFLHRFVQISAVVFIRDAGMALNVSFVLNLLFGLFVGLQHPNITLRLNALEYLTMSSTVATILCGMWFNWINISQEYSLNTSKAMERDAWGNVWLNDLVEICALVNLGLTCLIFFYASLLEFIDIRCLSKSHNDLDKIFGRRSSHNRRGSYWSHQGYLNSGKILVDYLHPVALRSWVDMIKFKSENSMNDEDRQLICDFGDTCYAISKFVKENPRGDPFSLSKDAILWRKFLSHHPAILSLLLYGEDGIKKSFICFFKEFYSLYWDPSRRSIERFFSPFIKLGKYLKRFIKYEDSPSPSFSQDLEFDAFKSQYKSDLEKAFSEAGDDHQKICPKCEAKCRKRINKYYPKVLRMEDGHSSVKGTSPTGSNISRRAFSSERAMSILDGMCRGVTARCKNNLCDEHYASDFLDMQLANMRNENVHIEDSDDDKDQEYPSTWKKCPPDISGIFSRRYRATVSYWLASISTIDKDIHPELYRISNGERIRFIRLLKSISNNEHKSGLEKLARILSLGSLATFSFATSKKQGKKLEDVFPELDVDLFTKGCLQHPQNVYTSQVSSDNLV